MSSNQQNRFRILFHDKSSSPHNLNRVEQNFDLHIRLYCDPHCYLRCAFWLSTAHDEKEWTVASQITVISAFILFVPACKAVPKPYMKSSRPEHSGRLLYCDRTCCRWVRSHDIPSAAFQCRCLPACPAPSSRPASPQGPSPCRWPSCRRGASRWR